MGRNGITRIARLTLALASIFPAALLAIPAYSASAPAYEDIRGVLKKVGNSGRSVTIEDANGKKTRVNIPGFVRVEKHMGLSELALGDKVHVQISLSQGSDVIGTIQVDRRRRGTSRPAWDGRPIPERPRRYQGWVSSLDVAARRVAIERIDGQVRWFSLSERLVVVAIGFPDLLGEGDSAVISFRGSAKDGEPILVRAESPEVKGRR